MVPSMAALIMRRRRQTAVGQRATPVLLALEVLAVARGTGSLVDLAAEGDGPCVCRIGARRFRWLLKDVHGTRADKSDSGGQGGSKKAA